MDLVKREKRSFFFQFFAKDLLKKNRKMNKKQIRSLTNRKRYIYIY